MAVTLPGGLAVGLILRSLTCSYLGVRKDGGKRTVGPGPS